MKALKERKDSFEQDYKKKPSVPLKETDGFFLLSP
jgi:hypothetical protein